MGLIDYGRPRFSFDLDTFAANHVSVKELTLSARMEAPFSARLKGVDSTGRVFTEHSVLDNLSNGGLHMCVMRGIPLGVEVTVAVRLAADPGFAPALRLATRGTVSGVSFQSSTTKHGESAGLTKRVSQWSALFIIDPVVRTQ
jgi:hypothetical protein